MTFLPTLRCTLPISLTAEGAEVTQRNAEDYVSTTDVNSVSGQVVDAAMRVHTVLGPGLLESAYAACLSHELRKRGLVVETQVVVPIYYDGVRMDAAYRIDLLVERAVVVELKAITQLLPVHEAQLLSHLRFADYRVGLLINFNVTRLKDGIKRMVNGA